MFVVIMVVITKRLAMAPIILMHAMGMFGHANLGRRAVRRRKQFHLCHQLPRYKQAEHKC